MDPNANSRQVSGCFAVFVTSVALGLFAQPTAPANAQTFAQHVISSSADNAPSVYSIDVDGDVDVLSASSNDDKIAWYENVPNESPVANAGSDQTVIAGETVILDGSASSDPDGNSMVRLEAGGAVETARIMLVK